MPGTGILASDIQQLPGTGTGTGTLNWGDGGTGKDTLN